MNTAFIAVHLGAGYHSEGKRTKYVDLCRKACKVAMDMLLQNISAVEAITHAMVIIENSPLTNAGIGSNLTFNGIVECDASIMDGKTLHYGAVGSLSGIQNPIKVAKELLVGQTTGKLSLGRIAPSCLVGPGAVQWATEHGFELVGNSHLVTAEASQAFKKYKRKLIHHESKATMLNTNECMDTEDCQEKLDTVGAVCIDMEGNVCSAVSSGGLPLKHEGRLGQAAMYGCGCWAQNSLQDGYPSVAASVSGVGEYLIKTLFARECCNSLLSVDDAIFAVQDAIQNKFLGSPFLRGATEKYVGALFLKYSSADSISELLWAHTTSSMCVSYMSASDKRPHVIISRQPSGSCNTSNVVIEGKQIKHKVS